MQAAFGELNNAHAAFLDTFEAAVRERLSPFAAVALQRLFEAEAHNHDAMIELASRASAAATIAISNDGTLAKLERAILDAACALEVMLDMRGSNVVTLRRRS
ncbi:hypothetical protein [Methylosinus sp. RM1]|uniref:hypothetical protein n=1 Tax=Methylosinus sp. RM1 TaxID=2583817 RepID=UPI00140D9DF1|nr:hypothetical protein [Methylosinus sp. RM1]